MSGPQHHHQPQPERVGMWHIEAAAPWRWACIYAALIVGTLLLSHAACRGWLPW